MINVSSFFSESLCGSTMYELDILIRLRNRSTCRLSSHSREKETRRGYDYLGAPNHARTLIIGVPPTRKVPGCRGQVTAYLARENPGILTRGRRAGAREIASRQRSTLPIATNRNDRDDCYPPPPAPL